MRVFGRGLILAALLCASAPSWRRGADSSVQPGRRAEWMRQLVGDHANCSLFSLGSLTGSDTVSNSRSSPTATSRSSSSRSPPTQTFWR